jgi:hypothetical protein
MLNNMGEKNSSLYDKLMNPIAQAALCLSGALLIMLVSKFLQYAGILAVSARFPWMTAASFLFFFAMANSVASLASVNSAQYWGRSIYSYMGLALGAGMFAWLFSSLSISEAGSYRWIFFVLTLGYLVFLSIMNMARRIVEFAQKEEWNHPRIRQTKRR